MECMKACYTYLAIHLFMTVSFRMTPYAVLPTGEKIGVIEVVTKATTLANIQKTEGGAVRGAFKEEVLLGWLRKKNDTDEK